MKSDDRRSRRIALVADCVMNPPAGAPDPMALLVERDWGVIALPPERLGRPAIARWMAGVADQVREFRRHGMAVVVLLDAAETSVIAELERACALPPAQSFPVHIYLPGMEERLAAFLDRHAAREPAP